MPRCSAYILSSFKIIHMWLSLNRIELINYICFTRICVTVPCSNFRAVCNWRARWVFISSFNFKWSEYGINEQGLKKKSGHGSHRRWEFQKEVTPVFSCCEEVQEGEEQDQPASGAILVLLKNTWSGFRRRKGGVRQKKTEAGSAGADMHTVNVTNSFWKFGHQC